jgi:DNA-binding response OmpR family regulator
MAKTVYVVDDEAVIAQTLAMILSQSGFAAKAFEKPLLALAAAENVPPDLLITDVMMPEMTGIDLAIRLRDHYPECKVLLFSGKAATADLLEDARRRG